MGDFYKDVGFFVFGLFILDLLQSFENVLDGQDIYFFQFSNIFIDFYIFCYYDKKF